MAFLFSPLLPGSQQLQNQGTVKVWNGTQWVRKFVKVWNGTQWVVKPVKFYNGTLWVVTDPPP